MIMGKLVVNRDDGHVRYWETTCMSGYSVGHLFFELTNCQASIANCAW